MPLAIPILVGCLPPTFPIWVEGGEEQQLVFHHLLGKKKSILSPLWAIKFRQKRINFLVYFAAVPFVTNAQTPCQGQQEQHTYYSMYPTNNTLLTNFRLSSKGEIHVNKHRPSTQIGAKCAKKKRVCTLHYIFQLSSHFACHHWWLGSSSAVDSR